MAFLNGNVKRPSLRHLLMIVRSSRSRLMAHPAEVAEVCFVVALGVASHQQRRNDSKNKKTNKHGGIVSWGCLDMSRYV